MSKPIITINTFPKDTTYVCLKNQLNKKILQEAIQQAGSQQALAAAMSPFFPALKIRQATVSQWLRQFFLRLDIVLWLLSYAHIYIDIHLNLSQLKGETTSRPLFHPKLPIYLTKELSALLANLYCDGYSNDRNSDTTEYFNQSSALISHFKNNLKSVFGGTQIYQRYVPETKMHNLKIPHYLGRLLHKRFCLDENKVPDEIKNSNETVRGSYLRAVFDDEGTISKGYGQIRLKMKYQSYVCAVKTLVESLGIQCSRVFLEKDTFNKFGAPCHYFTINGQYNLQTFSEKIGFLHPKKRRRLKKALSRIKLLSYGYRASEVVFHTLKEKGPNTSEQLAAFLHRDKRTVNYHLNKLARSKRVVFKPIFKRYSYQYLWAAKNDSHADHR